MIPFHHEHAEVNIIVRRSQEVHGLPKLCLVGGLNNGTHKKTLMNYFRVTLQLTYCQGGLFNIELYMITVHNTT